MRPTLAFIVVAGFSIASGTGTKCTVQDGSFDFVGDCDLAFKHVIN
jgi:hypothetical protein